MFEKKFTSEQGQFELIQNGQKKAYAHIESYPNGNCVTMYVIEKDLYYIYQIEFDEPLTNEQLLSFGLQKYEG